MKAYTIETLNIDKLLHQNDGEIIDVIEGTLLDNYYIATKRGYIILAETYVNCWTSKHTFYFFTDVRLSDKYWNKIEQAYIER